MSNTAIVTGSIGALAKQAGRSLAETFVSADCIVIVDTSGSMAAYDSRGGETRYNVACEELKNLQNSMPGKLAVIAFSDRTEFCPAGVPTFFGGGTDLAGALQFSKIADVPNMQFIVISDGQPDEPGAAVKVARTYQNKINVIYVGPESNPVGRDFLARLAKASGGQAITADRAKELASSVTKLLAAG